MALTILSVAYPFAPVGPDAVGGAEQIVAALDQALVAAGHRSVVVAAEGSTVAGTLVPVPRHEGAIDDSVRLAAWRRHRAAIAAAADRHAPDLIHLHGIDCAAYLPDHGPCLVTLHLPPDWYPDVIWHARPDVHLHCVSAAQARRCPPGARLLPPIPNGVPVDRLSARHARRGFALTMSRICPEKGVHLAIDAARRAGRHLVVAGEVFPYEAHQRYFAEEVLPRLGGGRRFVGPLGFRRKRRFLNAARCLVQPSLAEETSSLVTMEALAAGTPVVAFPNGAVPDIVEHGRTGFLVGDVAEMADAIEAAGDLDPEACRAAARERFSIGTMVDRYFAVYADLASERPRRLAAS